MTLTPTRSIRLKSLLGTVTLALGLAACGQPLSTPTTTGSGTPSANVQSGARDGVYDGTDRSWTQSASGVVRAQAIGTGDNQLSGEAFTAATNGWGPVERDKSNGEWQGGDGRTLTVNGQTFARGFGMHSNGSVTIDVGARCTTFTAQVGVDDEVGNLGSVVFQVFGDGRKLYDSGVVRGTDGARSVSVNITGVRSLQLVATDGGDGINHDHADWGNPVAGACSVSAPAPAPVTYSGPITITRGGTYTGNWQSLDPNVPAVSIRTDEPVTIVNSNIQGRGDLINGWWMNLTVRNTRGIGLNPNVYDRHAGRFVSAENVKNLVLENNLLDNTGGIYAHVFSGNAGAGQTIKILRNRVKNINGRKSNGAGGYLDSGYFLQFIQLNKIRNLPNVEIAWNEVINEPNKSFLEENINLYATSGTAASPIRIHNNFIKGAYAINPSTNTSYSGGGILVGDGSADGPDSVGAFVDVYQNQVVSTSNQGLAISGGHDHRFYNNRVVSSGRLPDGSRIAAQNVGAYVWDTMNGAAIGTWYNNSLRDNQIGWVRVNADGSTWLNNTWFASCPVLCPNNTSWPGAVTLDTENQEYQYWLDKVARSGVTVGPTN